MDLITVVIPIYNVEKYLEKCIKSVLNQTYKNIEVLLINDGSPDNSDKIMERFSEKDDRIKCFYKKNGGLSDARNYALKRANGKYICFIDSDDFIDKTYVEKLYNSIIKEKSEIAWCNFRKIKNNDKKEKIIITEEDLWSFEMASACNKLFLTSLFKKNKIEFPKGIWYEDLATIPRIIFISKKVSWVNEDLYNYNYNSSSITKTYSNRCLEMKKVLEILYDFAKERNLLEEKNTYEIIEYIFCFSGLIDTAFRICSAKDGNIKDYKKMVEWIEKLFPNIYSNEIAEKRFDLKRKIIFKLVKYRWFSMIKFLIKIRNLGREK